MQRWFSVEAGDDDCKPTSFYVSSPFLEFKFSLESPTSERKKKHWQQSIAPCVSVDEVEFIIRDGWVHLKVKVFHRAAARRGRALPLLLESSPNGKNIDLQIHNAEGKKTHSIIRSPFYTYVEQFPEAGGESLRFFSCLLNLNLFGRRRRQKLWTGESIVEGNQI